MARPILLGTSTDRPDLRPCLQWYRQRRIGENNSRPRLCGRVHQHRRRTCQAHLPRGAVRPSPVRATGSRHWNGISAGRYDGCRFTDPGGVHSWIGLLWRWIGTIVAIAMSGAAIAASRLPRHGDLGMTAPALNGDYAVSVLAGLMTDSFPTSCHLGFFTR